MHSSRSAPPTGAAFPTTSEPGHRPYPSPPWRLAGPCAVVTGLLPVAQARPRVPDDLAIVRVRPGLTVASIIVADYQDAATFPYSELAVMPALVRCRGIRGPWISDIWVNSEPSLQGGRQMWGLAKQHADFAWSFGGSNSVAVTSDGEALGSWSWAPPSRRVPYPAWFRGIGSVAGDRRRYRGRGIARLGKASAEFAVPDDSPLAEIYAALQRPIWMAGAVNLTFGDIRILTPPAAAPDARAT